MAGFLQDFLCGLEEEHLDALDPQVIVAASTSPPTKCKVASTAASKPASTQQSACATPQKIPSSAPLVTPSPKKKTRTPKSSASKRPPSLGGRGKDSKKRAERGTVGTFAGRRMPPSNPEAAAHFVRIRDAYRKLVAVHGKPRISISQSEFWRKVSAATDFDLAVAKYRKEHWGN